MTLTQRDPSKSTTCLCGEVERGHLHGSHDDLEAGVVLDEEAHAVVEPHRGRRVQRRLAVQLHVVRLSPVIAC